MIILQMYFDYNGGYGNDMYNQTKELAESITKEPGFLWKIWTENKEKKIAGGIYAFDTKENAEKYLKMHTKRIEEFGIGSNFRFEFFNVNKKLSEITNFKID
ncbi:putative monooxygenase YdhR [Campylobacter blaseri]|uniref:Monooxygenase n=1 Tax=Campylobacter blaseri TaxID=2042961 RepID=A0A2P8R253_9BACT|nr:monooxygenase [Campylobacter blaseri]PSM52573.1 monooxygenase [Campylobacter blaseri]PSM54221.1 monooxygenase [Campylobacter blaseri]QKF85872.1 putative monooxygenase YdhR [Campylobacter blaseri]